jgi:hypothetical protein
MPHLAVPFATFTALYVVLGVVVVLALRRHVFSADDPVVRVERGAHGAAADRDAT